MSSSFTKTSPIKMAFLDLHELISSEVEKWVSKLTTSNQFYQSNMFRIDVLDLSRPKFELQPCTCTIWVGITKLAKTLKISNSNYHSLNPNLAPLSIIYIAFFCWKKP
jgi:hypothetical protein